MKMRNWVKQATRKREGARSWINLPFILVLGALVIFGLGSGESFSTLWAYIVLLPIFLFQAICPTVLGWRLSISSWLVIAFGYFLFERIAYGIEGFNTAFLCIWGILPAIVLCFFKPRSSDGL